MKGSKQNWINVGLGLAVLVFSITTWVSYRSLVRLSETSTWVNHTHEVLEEVEALMSAVREAETAQRGYLITGDDHFLGPYQSALSRIDPLFQSVRNKTADNPDQQRRLANLRPLIERRLTTLQEVLDLRKKEGLSIALQQLTAGRGREEMEAVRKAVSEMKDEERRLLNARENRSAVQTRETVFTLSTVALFAVSLFILIFYLLNREIAERKRTERELKRTGAFLDSIVENIPIMLFIKDAKDLRFIRFNKAGEELLGRSREELTGKNDYDFFPKEQADLFTAKDRQVIAEGRLADIPEEPIETRLRGTRTLHTRKIPVFDEMGRPLYLLGISEDITDRKRAETKFRRVLESAPDSIVIVDQKGRIVLINTQTERLFEYGREELLGQAIEVLVPEHFRGNADRPDGALVDPGPRVIGGPAEALFAAGLGPRRWAALWPKRLFQRSTARRIEKG